jgi:hypothetical protein
MLADDLFPFKPDASTVDRIIAAVKGAPADINRTELARDLAFALSQYQIALHFKNAPAERLKRREKIRRAARELRSLLFNDEGLPHDLWVDLPQNISGITLRSGLKTLSEMPDEPRFQMGEIRALEALVGFWLRRIFESHFKMDATVTKDSIEDQYVGEMLDFACAVIRESKTTNKGKPYTRGTIATAFWEGKKFEKPYFINHLHP